MAKTVWKFSFEVADSVRLDMPMGAQVLSVQTQHGVPCLWALVDPTMPIIAYHFRLFGTGHPVPSAFDGEQHVGTFQYVGGLVFHLFEVDPLSAESRS